MVKVKLGIAETAAQFDIVHPEKVVNGGYYGSYGVIDFTTLTLDKAKSLIRFGFPYLRRKSTPAAVKTTPSPSVGHSGAVKKKKR